MPEGYVARLGEIACIAESTKGTKSTTINLAGTNSKFRVYDLKFEPDTQIFERRTMGKTLSRYSHIVGRTLARMTFKLELRKTATTDNADAWHPLIEACGWDFNDLGQWTPTTDQSLHKTLTMYAFIGSTGAACVRYGMRGAMGNVTLSANIGEPPMLEFEFFGVTDRNDVDNTPSGTFALKPTDDVLNTITHEGAVPGSFHGVALTYDGTIVNTSNFKLNMGNVVAPRDSQASDEGVLHYVITDRAPTIEIDPELASVSSLGIDLDALLGTELAVAWLYTQPAANSVNARTFTFNAPKCQVTAHPMSERNGIAVYNLTLALNKSAEPGDDEFTLLIEGV